MEKLTDLFLATERHLRGLENGRIKVLVGYEDHPRLTEFLKENDWDGVAFPEDMSRKDIQQLQTKVLYEIENAEKTPNELFTCK